MSCVASQVEDTFKECDIDANGAILALARRHRMRYGVECAADDNVASRPQGKSRRRSFTSRCFCCTTASTVGPWAAV